MTAPMSDHLFDPGFYGYGQSPRAKHEPVVVTAVNDGRWHLILRKGKEPHPLAHKLTLKMTTITVNGKQQIVALADGQRWEGAWQTACGLVGAALDLPAGAEVNVCPVCQARPSSV